VTRRIDRAALAIGIVLLALGPLALTLARAGSYKSTAVVSLNPANPAARYLPGARGLLADPIDVKDLQRAVAQDVGWFDTPRDLPNQVEVTSSGPGHFAVTARGPGTKEAQELAYGAARKLLGAAEVGATFAQTLQLKQVKQTLRQGRLSAARRAELQARRDALATSVTEHLNSYASKPTPATLGSERIGDRVVGALPGTRSFRPNPVYVAIAGISLAMALALWALALGPLRSRSGGSTPG
jgi:hypothetical protein